MASIEIRFDLRHRDDLDAYEVVPHIDGTPLTALIDRFETDAGMQPAGDAYGGLVPRSFRFASMEDHFHARRPTGGRAPRTPLLACACGDWGCWPLMARITVTADLVIWDSFEQPHRETRDYTAFGPFRFDRGQYDRALRALSKEIDSAGT